MSNPKQLTFPWNKDNKSSFDNFYTTPINKQLLFLLRDETFNDDLLIFGAKDSGKTYLLQALCNQINKQGKSSFFLPMRQAMNLSVDILESLENMDLVCIDGIESIVEIDLDVSELSQLRASAEGVKATNSLLKDLNL